MMRSSLPIGPVKLIVAVAFLLFPARQMNAQRILDPIGDIPAGNPSYIDLSEVRVRQATSNIFIDLYPVAPIPRGNQVGITTTTVFEFYIDVDSNAATGARLDNLGYEYKFRIDLNTWNGKSWIDGTVYWDFDSLGNSSSEGGFEQYALDLVPQRWRLTFSLISLKWRRMNWVARMYYGDHWAERVPDSGYASLVIDTTLVPAIDTANSEYIQLIYPATFQTTLETFDILHTVDQGAQIERAICGTDFIAKPQQIMFNPWINGVAYEGNPIMMGSWSWGTVPPWFILFHELGHDFTLAADRFRRLYPSGGYVSAGGDDWHFGTDFVEAWATMVGLQAIHELVTNSGKYGIVAAASQDLSQQLANTRNSYRSALLNYEVIPDHSHLYPDVVDGIFLALADSLGYDIIPRWFKILQPPDSAWSRLDGINPIADYDGAKITAMTITACAFSVAAKTELRDLFRTRWDFPIDNILYGQIKPEIDRMINSATWVESAREGSPLGFLSLGNYPNPFNARTTITFQLPKESTIRLRLYNVIGQLMRDTSLGTFQAGTYNIAYEASDVPSGIYYYVLTTSQGSVTNKLVLVR